MKIDMNKANNITNSGGDLYDEYGDCTALLDRNGKVITDSIVRHINLSHNFAERDTHAFAFKVSGPIATPFSEPSKGDSKQSNKSNLKVDLETIFLNGEYVGTDPLLSEIKINIKEGNNNDSN